MGREEGGGGLSTWEEHWRPPFLLLVALFKRQPGLNEEMGAVQITAWCFGFFNWSIVDLQCCVNFRYTAKWFGYTYMYMNRYLCSSLVLFRLIGKDLDAGKDWGQKEKGVTEDEMVGWHRRLNGCEFEQTWEIVKDREARCAAVHGVTKSGTGFNDWTTIIVYSEMLNIVPCARQPILVVYLFT